MLLDEPFASLDPNLRARLRTDIVDVLRATGTPALFVTHDQAEALSVGDRVAVMRAGRIEQDGAPDDVYHRPANRFVAGFMGDAAFLPVDGRRRPSSARAPAPTGSLLVVRPHDVAIAADGDRASVRRPSWRPSSTAPTRTYRLALPSGTEILATVAHTVHADVGADACTPSATRPSPSPAESSDVGRRAARPVPRRIWARSAIADLGRSARRTRQFARPLRRPSSRRRSERTAPPSTSKARRASQAEPKT